MVTRPYTVEELLEENKDLRRQRRILNHALVEIGQEGTKPVAGFQYPPPRKATGTPAPPACG